MLTALTLVTFAFAGIATVAQALEATAGEVTAEAAPGTADDDEEHCEC